MDDIILVDLFDRELGSCEKMEAHLRARLHRAFSVFIYGEKGFLIQRRALEKYHSGGLWANACCSHPRQGEETLQAANRRLKEEAGIHCPIDYLFSFTYYHRFDNGVCEYEFDHVFAGRYDGEAVCDPLEIAEIRWIMPDELQGELLSAPERFAPWFLIAAPRVFRELIEKGEFR